MFDDAAFSTESFSTDSWLTALAALVSSLANVLRVRVNLNATPVAISDQPLTVRTRS